MHDQFSICLNSEGEIFFSQILFVRRCLSSVPRHSKNHLPGANSQFRTRSLYGDVHDISNWTIEIDEREKNAMSLEISSNNKSDFLIKECRHPTNCLSEFCEIFSSLNSFVDFSLWCLLLPLCIAPVPILVVLLLLLALHTKTLLSMFQVYGENYSHFIFAWLFILLSGSFHFLSLGLFSFRSLFLSKHFFCLAVILHFQRSSPFNSDVDWPSLLC